VHVSLLSNNVFSIIKSCDVIRDIVNVNQLRLTTTVELKFHPICILILKNWDVNLFGGDDVMIYCFDLLVYAAVLSRSVSDVMKTLCLLVNVSLRISIFGVLRASFG